MKPIDKVELARLIPTVLSRLETIPSLEWKNYQQTSEARHQAIDRMIAELTAIGAKFGKSGSLSYASSVSLAGIRATCTSSVDGALQNWITAARKRLAA